MINILDSTVYIHNWFATIRHDNIVCFMSITKIDIYITLLMKALSLKKKSIFVWLSIHLLSYKNIRNPIFPFWKWYFSFQRCAWNILCLISASDRMNVRMKKVCYKSTENLNMCSNILILITILSNNFQYILYLQYHFIW